MARMRSTPTTGSQRVMRLEERLFAFGVEEVQASGVESQLDAVARSDVDPRIDARGELVATDSPVQVLVGPEALHHVDLHVKRRAAIRDAVGDRLGPEAERAFLRADRLGQLDLESGRLG